MSQSGNVNDVLTHAGDTKSETRRNKARRIVIVVADCMLHTFVKAVNLPDVKRQEGDASLHESSGVVPGMRAKYVHIGELL